jgi:UDP-N-acetylglucosamine--N-acetylmuramyl-(pentapeptide) pyrophosphoryl-undecaprenol N-acetylglucosamine transferase
VLVVGGIQGAQILNRLVPPALARVAAAGIPFDVAHQAGKGRAGDVAAAYAALGFAEDRAAVHEFLDDMAAAYASADVVVARAGAMTVAEIAGAGRPALLVPFAGATHGHQEANARALESEGAAVVVTEAAATEESIAAALTALLGDPPRLVAMGEKARGSAAPDAAARLCDLLFEVEAA